MSINLFEIFHASPVIYSILLALSLFAFSIWLYSLITLRKGSVMPTLFLKKVGDQLREKRFDAAAASCENARYLCSSVLSSALAVRTLGYKEMCQAMQDQGKRCGVQMWQRISLLNDIAIVAPMLGLLGTVMGLFYAFYDVNQSPDTLASIFDGLGIAVGSTVFGLIVAIASMIFSATLKFRIVRLLGTMEGELLSMTHLIEAS